MKRKISKLVLIFIILFGMVNTVFAEENNNIVDFTKKGTITVTLSDEGNNLLVEGANIRISKLADAYSDNNNLAFSYHSNLLEYKDEIKESKLSNEILDCIHESDLFTKEGITNDLGTVIFDELDLGLYLVEQTNKVDGYSKIDAFLVYIPRLEESNWVYRVDAVPKVDIIRLFDLSVRKEWNVSINSDTPDKVIIELLKDDEVIDKVILNEENNWEYTWEQIEVSDKYLVREVDIPVGYTPTYKQVDNTFIVTNTKTLVQTGQMSFIIWLLIITGLVFIISGLVVRKNETDV